MTARISSRPADTSIRLQPEDTSFNLPQGLARPRMVQPRRGLGIAFIDAQHPIPRLGAYVMLSATVLLPLSWLVSPPLVYAGVSEPTIEAVNHGLIYAGSAGAVVLWTGLAWFGLRTGDDA